MPDKLPLYVLDLLRQHTQEGERTEYKAGWNPDAIIRTLCAVANDFENLGGGHVVLGQNCDPHGQRARGMLACGPQGSQQPTGRKA
ncbi:MAG: helix-turn-helix domain-containing protein [Ramlibacter sp.]